MLNDMLGSERGVMVGKYLSYALVILIIFLGVETIKGLKEFSYIGKDVYPQRTITVSGDAEVFAVPDIASFSFSVVEVADTVAEAQSMAESKMSQILAILENEGIEDKDIKTSNYNFYPKYEWTNIVCVTTPCPSGRNELVGYEVNQTITVKVRDTENAGNLITQVGSAGASNVSGVNFTIDDEDSYKEEARRQAIEEAKANARQLADDLGVRLGKTLYFNESGNYPVAYNRSMGMGGDMAVMESAAPASLPAGENRIYSQVSITFEIK